MQVQKRMLMVCASILALGLFPACDEPDPVERFAQPQEGAAAAGGAAPAAAPGQAPPQGAPPPPGAEGVAPVEAAENAPPPPNGSEVAAPAEGAQGPQGPAAGNQVITEEMKKNFPCGDAICDDEEKKDANLCPRDCNESPAKGDDWCGDGICDARERFLRDCTDDCTSQ